MPTDLFGGFPHPFPSSALNLVADSFQHGRGASGIRGSLAVTQANSVSAASGDFTAAGEDFTPDTIIQTTDNPQTVVNANANVGHVFQFAAGTHNRGANLTPSANNQVFQGPTNGVPVSVTPTNPDGASLGKTKTLWSSGTPTAIMDGGGTTAGFMVNHGAANHTGIRIRRLKIQNFVDSTAPPGVVGGAGAHSWIIEENWIVGGNAGVRIANSMIVRKNRFRNQTTWWVKGHQATGTLLDPIIIEDNDIADINLDEGPANGFGDPKFDAGMKLSGGAKHTKLLRNYGRNIHGPLIWFDGQGDTNEILDNIGVDCGLDDGGGGGAPYLFYEISAAHGGCLIDNNWCLGMHAHIRVSHSHGTAATPIRVRFNTVDCDAGDSQGIHIKDSNSRIHVGPGDSTDSHPVINTNSLPNGATFMDHIIIEDNVVRKRNAAFLAAMPIGGSQTNDATVDLERNYRWVDNRYEVNAAITTPFKWDTGNMNFATWQTKRAATGDVQNTGPFFDINGDFVTWSGTKQFADTPCGWEG